MKLQDICVSLELAKELKEAGFPQESLFDWFSGKLYRRLDNDRSRTYSAPTVAELGEVINKWNSVIPLRFTRPTTSEWFMPVIKDVDYPHFQGKSMADCLAKMWLYLKNEGLIK